MTNVNSLISSATESVNETTNLVKNEISNKVSGTVSQATSLISDAQNIVGSVSNDVASVKNSIMNNIEAGKEQIANIKNAASDALNKGQTALNKLNSISDSISSTISSNLSSAKTLFNQAKKDITKIEDGKAHITTATDTKSTDIKDSSVYDKLTLSKDEAMAYDSNGMKHFMNIWLGTMSEEGIPYTTLGMRRWALTVEDEKVYGNAFLERQSSETYKTLDSDGIRYWLSDYNSRHYYGEAADITGPLSTILETIALNDNVLDVMHHYGICIQLETSQSGHSKGTHFHGSTDKDNPQTKWWGIVNQIRDKNGLKLYTVVPNSEYYEIETKNEVKFA